MHFPDQSHINQVRDALWRRSGDASVMVGAGFSRNAFSAVPGTVVSPTLLDLAQAIFSKLYPQDSHPNREDATELLPKSDSFPLLAQEFEVAFGRGRLHQFLEGLIRDNELMPTHMHERFVSLPWRDVFTTNWDTLLERSIASAPDRKYSILRNKDEIPFANQPRIAKLHGSLPAHYPLICTQEDYRTYPAKFAPFVNTVQQAMMETVFLLIGFSGEDPNFIHWTGWVRDNLGESAPKIYLAGLLDLSPHRRRMLEQRNVVSIDLARHPKASEWPEHQRHHYATEWILHTLERGHPYTPTDWPSPRKRNYPPVPVYLQPVVEIDSDQPQEEPWANSESNSGDLEERVDSIVQIWTHNRNLYPGWLAVPVSVRANFSSITNAWEPKILSVLPNLDPVRQLRAVYELVWRREILLDPVSNELEAVAENVLQQIDCRARTIRDVSKAEVEWGAVRAEYRSVAIALVTTARYRFDHEAFQKRVKALQDFRNEDPDVSQRIYHERCLWAIYSLDYKSLSELLNDWSTEDCDPVWMVRKAALLYETNRVDEACELTDRALSTIRRIPDDSRSVAGPTREGWSQAIAAVLESIPSWMRSDRGDAELTPDLSHFYRRWQELAAIKCDSQSEIRGYADALAPTSRNRDAPPFDFGFKTIPGIQFSNVAHARWVAARRAIRLAEVAGLPTFSFDTLKLAADELSSSEPEMAVRLILRTLNYDGDDFLKRILSRPRVAVMPMESAQELTKICNGIIGYALPRIGGVDARGRILFWTERLRVAMEVLSRLVVRLSPSIVEETLSSALTAYENGRIVQDLWLHGPVCNTLKRSWQSLPKPRRAARFLDLLSAPILGTGSTTRAHSLYPRPEELMLEQLSPPDRTNDNEGRWQQIISRLVSGLNEGGQVRERASLWVSHIAIWKRLTEEEAVKVARALWNEKFAGFDGLPRQTSLLDWVFMVLPEPKPGLAEQRFRCTWLTASLAPRENARRPDDILWQTGNAVAKLKHHGYQFALSENEQSHLAEVVRRWSSIPVPSLHGPFTADPTPRALEGLRSILTAIQIPTDIAEKLRQKMERLNESGIPAYRLIPGLLTAMPNRLNDLAVAMRKGLISDKSDLAEGAAKGLYDWLILANETAPHIQPPPDDLVREIGIIIATSRMNSLGSALQIAQWVFDRGADSQREIIRDLALQGLEYLSEELQYVKGISQDNIDLPLLRWHSVQLAFSMARRDLRGNPAVARWLQNVEEDPLPEIRYALDPASERQCEDLAVASNELDTQE